MEYEYLSVHNIKVTKIYNTNNKRYKNSCKNK